jgi:hypothetical protein
MSSAEDSPARTSALPERALAWLERVAGSGLNTSDSFASYDRATSSWRTSQLCLDGDLALFSEIWPRAGMTRNGIAFQHQPLAPRTDVTESGSWPTTTLTDSKNGANATANRREGESFNPGVTLVDAVRMWPTPTARDHKSDSCSAEFRAKRDAMTMGKTLPWEVGGLLNPTWVEWLMGYPTEWTALKDWGTRSSRKSRSGSAVASSKRKR